MTAAAFVLGIGLIVAGVALVSIPAAFVVGGGSLVSTSLLYERNR